MKKSCHEPERRLREWMDRYSTTQTQVADAIGVSREAVSKWCSGEMRPSKASAILLEVFTGRAVPATIWPRRALPEPRSKGARALQNAAKRRNVNIFELSRQLGLPERGMHRWATNQNAPRPGVLAKLNDKLGLKLRLSDFEVAA